MIGERGDFCRSPFFLLKIRAKKYAHLLDEFQDTLVGDFIKNKIGVLAVIDYALASQNIQVLGNIRIGGFHLIPDFTNGELFVLQEAENFQADRMGHRLEQLRHCIDLFVLHLLSSRKYFIL